MARLGWTICKRDINVNMTVDKDTWKKETYLLRRPKIMRKGEENDNDNSVFTFLYTDRTLMPLPCEAHRMSFINDKFSL